jgi:ABC-type oligopeptide transport system substrate-binding subunit
MTPKRRSTMKPILSLIAALLAAGALAVSAPAADKYVPGVTDFPTAERAEPYIPGVTDFPSYAPEAPVAGVEVHVADGFDWLDAAFGASVGLALGALAAASLPTLRRRTGLSAA